VKQRVLFVCTGNRARSQMAEGLLRHLAGDRFEAHSAGTLPGGLAAETIAVMREIGIDVSQHRSKSVDEHKGREFDVVITVCDVARQSCPVFPGGRQLHWDVEDPSVAIEAGATYLEAFRRARDDLLHRVEDFVSRAASDYE
jgi:arsenate reductase